MVEITYQRPQTIPGVRTYGLSADEVKAAITQWLGPRAKDFPKGVRIVSFNLSPDGAQIRAEVIGEDEDAQVKSAKPDKE